jgi:hypothetical protein
MVCSGSGRRRRSRSRFVLVRRRVRVRQPAWLTLRGAVGGQVLADVGLLVGGEGAATGVADGVDLGSVGRGVDAVGVARESAT